MTVVIYALVDPRDSEVRYIGNTGNLWQRFECHLREGRDTLKGKWVTELLASGLEPKMKVLETTGNDYLDVESKWIRHGLRQGWKLFNQTARGLTSELHWHHILSSLPANTDWGYWIDLYSLCGQGVVNTDMICRPPAERNE